MPDTSNIQIIPPGVTKWGGSVVLKAHGCVLLERFTGKSYTYRVVNLETGAAAYICHKPKPIHESEREAVIGRFLTSGAASGTASASGSERCVDTKRDNKVSNEKLTDSLAYIFETLLPEHGYSLRTEQTELAEDILETLRRRMISLSEAGVGIGKTHAYLIAAALVERGRVNDFWLRGNYPGMAYIAEMPVVVATSSIALQKAIVKDYIPEISNILMTHGVIKKSLTGVIRKGKEHYVCERRLCLLWRQTSDNEVKQLIEPLINRKCGIDLGEIDTITPYVKRRINVTGHCGVNCGLQSSCRYKAFIKDAQSDKYDFQICNHNYLLADVIRRVKGQRPLIPNYQAIIIDEAHKFLPAARQMYGTELSSHTLPWLAKRIHSFVFLPGQGTAELWQDADKLEGQAKRLFHVLVGNIPDIYTDDDAERFKTEIDRKAERHLRIIREVLNRLMEGLEKRQVFQKYENIYSHTLWELENIKEQIAAFEKHGDLVYWLEKPEGLYSPDRDGFGLDETLLCAIPKKLGEMLHAALWDKGVPIILTSGTLSAGGDFTHIKLGMGLDKLKPGAITETSRQSSFDYRENALIYISEVVPFPNNKDTRYIAAVAVEMERLIIAAHGHTVALFTSYRMMDFIFDALKKRSLPFPLFMLGRGRLNAIEQFRQSGNGVLFAAGSVWEGIDLPGDVLSLVVIVKLPFAVPDPINEHEQLQFGSMEKYKNAVIIPDMIVKLKQGFGRLIRTETDTGVVALLDSRVRDGGAYRDKVLRSLPDCRVTSNIAAVRNFLIAKKPLGYFK